MLLLTGWKYKGMGLQSRAEENNDNKEDGEKDESQVQRKNTKKKKIWQMLKNNILKY